MSINYKCPDCGDEMKLTEDAHKCECGTEFSIQEADEKFNNGELVGLVEEFEENIDEAKKDEDPESDGVDEDEDEADDKSEKDDKSKLFKKEDVDYTIDMSESVATLVDGEDLSEDFQKKAATIFESTVNTKVREIAETMEANFKVDLAEATDKIEVELSEKVNDYLGYVVEQWMKDNEVAIENGARTEVTESFIAGLKTLFTESYIEVPQEKHDLVAELSEKVEKLESDLNESVESGIEMKKVISSQESAKIIASVSESLADTDKEKMADLAESVEFTNVEEFTEKLNTLKESYFKKGAVQDLDEEVEIKEEVADVVNPYGDLIANSIKHMKSQAD